MNDDWDSLSPEARAFWLAGMNDAIDNEADRWALVDECATDVCLVGWVMDQPILSPVKKPLRRRIWWSLVGRHVASYRSYKAWREYGGYE